MLQGFSVTFKALGAILFKLFKVKLAHSSFSSSVHSLLPKENLFKNILDFTTAGDWDCVAAVECLPVSL